MFIIDDDPIHRLLMSKLFERQPKSCKLSFFENGQKGLAALETIIAEKTEALPDIILLDIEMPLMNGWQFMDKYSALPGEIKKQIRVYMVSSSFSDQDQERVKDYPDIQDYVVKPLRMEKIIELLD
ncbi:transcriptional regulator [Niabella soli DSM 19437]|uniref:Transcriptional regulator n=1 Tax=Niabella soli DSM 19437 TaxID=929713 RepID=W0F477_9BACT|nr:transcriptional regulator [Niabella soli DSM 19437]